MKKILILNIASLVLTLNLIGQTRTVKGILKDKNNKEISNALICIFKNDSIYRASYNYNDGNFSIYQLPAGHYLTTAITLNHNEKEIPIFQSLYIDYLKTEKTTIDSVHFSTISYMFTDSIHYPWKLDTSINKKDSLGRKQGLWNYMSFLSKIKKVGNFKDDKKTGEWLYFKSKSSHRWYYYYYFSGGKKKLNRLYYTDGTYEYYYIYKNGRLQLDKKENLIKQI